MMERKKNSFLKFEENGDEEDESSGVERGIFSPRKKSSSKKLNGGRYSDGKTTERNVQITSWYTLGSVHECVPCLRTIMMDK